LREEAIEPTLNVDRREVLKCREVCSLFGSGLIGLSALFEDIFARDVNMSTYAATRVPRLGRVERSSTDATQMCRKKSSFPNFLSDSTSL